MTTETIREIAAELVEECRAEWVSPDASGREVLGVTYGANAASPEEADAEAEACREYVGGAYVRAQARVTFGESGNADPGYYTVLLVNGAPVYRR